MKGCSVVTSTTPYSCRCPYATSRWSPPPRIARVANVNLELFSSQLASGSKTGLPNVADPFSSVPYSGKLWVKEETNSRRISVKISRRIPNFCEWTLCSSTGAQARNTLLRQCPGPPKGVPLVLLVVKRKETGKCVLLRDVLLRHWERSVHVLASYRLTPIKYSTLTTAYKTGRSALETKRLGER